MNLHNTDLNSQDWCDNIEEIYYRINNKYLYTKQKRFKIRPIFSKEVLKARKKEFRAYVEQKLWNAVNTSDNHEMSVKLSSNTLKLLNDKQN